MNDLEPNGETSQPDPDFRPHPLWDAVVAELGDPTELAPELAPAADAPADPPEA